MSEDNYELILPDLIDENVDRYEQQCLRIVFHAIDVLPSKMKELIGRAWDYSGPAAYCTAIADYVEQHSPFIVHFPYEETYDQ